MLLMLIPVFPAFMDPFDLSFMCRRRPLRVVRVRTCSLQTFVSDLPAGLKSPTRLWHGVLWPWASRLATTPRHNKAASLRCHALAALCSTPTSLMSLL